jgi:oxygen-independent coproporphyrinogen-3 oxidase
MGGNFQGKKSSNDDATSFGLYVHIPFCRRRCNYCDFAIVPIGINESSQNSTVGNTGFQKITNDYTDALLTEINMIAASSFSKISLRSIYFGGGTPSLAPISTLQKIMHAICKSSEAPFRLEPDAEVTIEMDPGTFDLNGLIELKKVGFNRISLGVQSFDNTILSNLGRVHRARDVYESIDMIRQVYGEENSNYSIDLISGVPGLTLATWTETLYEAVHLNPRPLHISLYDLQVEKATAFGKRYDGGDARDEESTNKTTPNETAVRPKLPSTEECAWMYRYASGYLGSKNFEHYEISSYAYNDPKRRKSHRSKHNQIYWEVGGQWHAIGLGATSNLGGVRFARPRALSDYVSWAKELNATNTPPFLKPSPEFNDENDELLDIIMTRLRTSDGLDLDWIAAHNDYNDSHVKAILRGFELAIDLKLGTATTSPGRTHGAIRLSDPDGFLFSNNIISNIFMEIDSMQSK